MPALYHAGIQIRLGTAPLEQTLTSNVVLKKGDVAARQFEKADVQLREGPLLDEECVPFPGQAEAFSMHWLGDAPFLMAKIADPFGGRRNITSRVKHFRDHQNIHGSTITDMEDIGSSSRSHHVSRTAGRGMPPPALTAKPPQLSSTSASEPGQSEGELSARALVLHVLLTHKTFFENIHNGSQQHLKIDVFLNGQLSSCVLVHQADVRTGAKSLHQIFAGNRIDFLVERPWVIHPPGLKTDHTVSDTRIVTNATSRWTEIGQALMAEANARGTNTDGERPPSAQYLAHLAQMQMPPVANELQKPGGKSFGVVDVIVTVGLGKKLITGAGYLKTPKRLLDERYSIKFDDSAGTNNIGLKGQDIGVGSQEHARTREKDIVQIDGADDQNLLSKDLGQVGVKDHQPSAAAHSQVAGVALNTLSPPSFQNPFTNQVTPSLALSGIDVCQSFPKKSGAASGDSILPINPLWNSSLGSEATNDAQLSPGTNMQGVASTHTPMLTHHNEQTSTSSEPNFTLNPYHDHSNPYQASSSGLTADFSMADAPSLTLFQGHTSKPLRNQSFGYTTQPYMGGSNTPFSRYLGSSNKPTGLSQSSLSAQVVGETGFSSGQSNASPYQYGNSSETDNIASGSIFSSSLTARSISLQRQQQPCSIIAQSRLPSSSHQMGSLPPIGLFRPTERPKSRSLVTHMLSNTGQPTTEISVRRLVIVGVNGTRVVDHTWNTAQRIFVSRGKKRSCSIFSTSYSRQESLNSSLFKDKSGKSRQKLDAAQTLPNASTFSLPPINSKDAKRGSGHAEPVPNLGLSMQDKPLEPCSKEVVAPGVAEEAASDGANSPVNHSKGVTARRVNLSVQGPKANHFVFDNPEELLRRKRTRSQSQSQSRSTSPTKRNSLHERRPNEHLGKGGKAVENNEGEGSQMVASNSGLSSLLLSPGGIPTLEHEEHGVTELSLNPSFFPPPSTSDDLLPPYPVPPKPADSVSLRKTRGSTALTPPQPVSSSHQELRSSMPPPNTPASRRPRSGSRPETQRTGARKAQVAPPARQPRTAEQLDTIDNHPLSQNCVIQLAESRRENDKATGATNLLRQVKCERQGVFAEESVVVGVRFLVGA